MDQSGSLELDLYKLDAHFHSEGDAVDSPSLVLEALDESCVRRIGSTLRKGGLGRMYLWDHVESMVRVQARLGTPHQSPRGATNAPFMDMKHFEVVLVPLFIHLSRRFIVAMSDFFVPPDEASERKHDDQSRDAFLGANTHHSRYTPKVMSQSSTSFSSGGFHPPPSNPFYPTSPASGGSVSSVGSGGSGGGSRDGRALLFGDNDDTRLSSSSVESKGTQKKEDGFLKKKAHIQYLRLGQLVAFVSYKGENWAKLEDFDALQVKIHPYVIRDQTCSFGELGVGVRNHVVMDILSQVNRNFVNIGAFLATKFSGLGSCPLVDRSTAGSLPVHETGHDGSDNEDSEEEGDDEGVLKERRRSTAASEDGGPMPRTDSRSYSDPMQPQDRSSLLLGPNKGKKTPLRNRMNPFGKK